MDRYTRHAVHLGTHSHRMRCHLQCNQVLQGAPPALQEVGPYVFDTTLVNYNIQYLPADALGPDRVQWSTLSFSDFSLSKSCPTCADLNATVRKSWSDVLSVCPVL